MELLKIKVRRCGASVIATSCVTHNFGSFTNIEVIVKKNRGKCFVAIDSQSYFHDENQWEEYRKETEFFCRLNRPNSKDLAIKTILKAFNLEKVPVCVEYFEGFYKKQDEFPFDEEVPF